MVWRTGAFVLYVVLTTMGCADDDGLAPGLDPEVEARIDTLLAEMTLEEKVRQMHGSGHMEEGLWLSHGVERLGVPGFRMVDGPRGVQDATGAATAFPVAAARGASWNVDLERRVGEAIGREVAAKGGNVLLAPCINMLRHPRWGRAQETYGEDVHHMARLGVAFIEGAQQHVAANAKHYAANSIEDTRFEVDVRMDERTLREIYLPAFRRAVQEAGVASVMSAYNQVQGTYASENAPLLRDILKEEWGFQGFVVSDWLAAVQSTVPSALAGLDLEMPGANYYGPPLIEAVEAGEVPMTVIDDAVRRLVRIQLTYGMDDPPPPPSPDVIEGPEHVALARQAALESMVLLENRQEALPLDATGLSSLAVAGRLADTANLGDAGSSNVAPTHTVTPLAGLAERAGDLSLTHVAPEDTLSEEDAAVVAAADAVVVVVGLTEEEEGESIPTRPGGDRTHMGLPEAHVQLIRDVAEQNPRTIVVLQGGSALIVEEWVGDVQALVMAWYPGMEGGTALARLLFGDDNFSGKLPVSVPTSEEQLPPFDNVSHEVTYGYFHGYRHLDREGLAPRYPFGHGLSYTRYAYEGLEVSGSPIGPEGTLVASVEVTNTGAMAGEEVVQLYVGYEGATVERSVRELKAFRRVALEPGETRTVTLEVGWEDLTYWDAGAGRRVLEATDLTIHAGPSSGELPLQAHASVAP